MILIGRIVSRRIQGQLQKAAQHFKAGFGRVLAARPVVEQLVMRAQGPHRFREKIEPGLR